MAKPLVPMPVTSIGQWQNVRYVDSIVTEAENGLFSCSALLVDQILRDDRIYGVLTTRVLGLLGKELEFEPGKDTAQGRRFAKDIDEAWPRMFSHAALSELLLWGIVQGVGFGQIIEDGDEWSLEVWHPSALRWDEYKRCYLVQARDTGEFELVKDGRGYRDEAGRRWVLYTPYGYGNAGRRGLLRNLARLYLERQWAHRDRARYSEIHGMPFRVGIAPASATSTQVEQFGDDLGDMGSDSTIVVKQGETGNIWDAKLVEATGKSHELFEGEIAQLDKAIATLVLGQSQSTDGQAGLGSNAQAGEAVRIDIMRADGVGLADTLRNQFLVAYYEHAYNAPDMAPWPKWCVDPPEDKKAMADVRLVMAQADKLNIESGMVTPEEASLSRFGDGDYSLDTVIDTDVREAIKKTSAKAMQIEAEKALEHAENPPLPVAPGQPVPGQSPALNAPPPDDEEATAA